jgi:hypothetical protein
MNRNPGPAGVVLLGVASAATLIALFPLGLDHRVLHDWRQKECAERLRTLEKLAIIRATMYGCRRRLHPPGEARWLAIQGTTPALVDPEDLPLFFCPHQASPVAAAATDYRGTVSRRWGIADDPVGADKEGNHPRCCPLNVVMGDLTLRTCRHDDPWRLDLRRELSP